MRAEFFFNKCHEAIHLGWHVCLSHMSTSSISSIIRPSVIITQCPDLPFFVCHTKRRVLTTCSENEKESGSQGERQEHKYQKKKEEAVFTNCCHLLSIHLIIIVLICNPHRSPKHNFLFKTRG